LNVFSNSHSHLHPTPNFPPHARPPRSEPLGDLALKATALLWMLRQLRRLAPQNRLGDFRTLECISPANRKYPKRFRQVRRIRT